VPGRISRTSGSKAARSISRDARAGPGQRQRRRTLPALNTRGSSRRRRVGSPASTRSHFRNTIPTCRGRSSGRVWRRIGSTYPNPTKPPTCSCRRRFGCALGCRCRNDRSFDSRFVCRQPCSRCSPGRCRRRSCHSWRRRHSRRHRCHPSRCSCHRVKCRLLPRRSLLHCRPLRPHFRPIHRQRAAQRHRRLQVARRPAPREVRPPANPAGRDGRRRSPKWHCMRLARKWLTT
jgi:hypothetical protein